MKAVKILSIVLIHAGAAFLVLSYFLGWVNDNVTTVYSFVAMIVGLIAYIYSSKRCLEDIKK